MNESYDEITSVITVQSWTQWVSFFYAVVCTSTLKRHVQTISDLIITCAASCEMLQMKMWCTMIIVLNRDCIKKISYHHQSLLQTLLSILFFLTFCLRKFRMILWSLIRLVLLIFFYFICISSSLVLFIFSFFSLTHLVFKLNCFVFFYFFSVIHDCCMSSHLSFICESVLFLLFSVIWNLCTTLRQNLHFYAVSEISSLLYKQEMKSSKLLVKSIIHLFWLHYHLWLKNSSFCITITSQRILSAENQEKPHLPTGRYSQP